MPLAELRFPQNAAKQTLKAVFLVELKNAHSVVSLERVGRTVGPKNGWWSYIASFHNFSITKLIGCFSKFFRGDMEPLVSVLILTFNSEDFIRDTVVSVLEQSYKNIEIIIGDDCSSDRTLDILCELSMATDIPIRIIKSIANRGITLNMNSCLEQCSGDYIFLLGGDDIFLPGKISAQVSFLEANKDVVICYHDVSVFDSNSGVELYRYNRDRHGFHVGGVEKMIRQGTFNCGCATAVRNINLPKCNKNIKFASDWLWYVDVLATSKGRISYIDGVYARYRRHPKNITSMSALETQVNEIVTTLEFCEISYPDMHYAVRVARSERLLTYAIKFLINRQFTSSFGLVRRAFQSNIWGWVYVISRKFRHTV